MTHASDSQPREPFSGATSDCPDLRGSMKTIEATLPDFCNLRDIVKSVSAAPGVPAIDIPSFGTPCPCPKSENSNASFKTSDDCCDWSIIVNTPEFTPCRNQPAIRVVQDNHVNKGEFKIESNCKGNAECCDYDYTLKYNKVTCPAGSRLVAGEVTSSGLGMANIVGTINIENNTGNVCESKISLDLAGGGGGGGGGGCASVELLTTVKIGDSNKEILSKPYKLSSLLKPGSLGGHSHLVDAMKPGSLSGHVSLSPRTSGIDDDAAYVRSILSGLNLNEKEEDSAKVNGAISNPCSLLLHSTVDLTDILEDWFAKKLKLLFAGGGIKIHPVNHFYGKDEITTDLEVEIDFDIAKKSSPNSETGDVRSETFTPNSAGTGGTFYGDWKGNDMGGWFQDKVDKFGPVTIEEKGSSGANLDVECSGEITYVVTSPYMRGSNTSTFTVPMPDRVTDVVFGVDQDGFHADVYKCPRDTNGGASAGEHDFEFVIDYDECDCGANSDSGSES